MQGDAGDADGAGARQGLSWSWEVAPGVFTWTTPAGRTFTTTPDVHAA
jgi:hypothetical protein